MNLTSRFRTPSSERRIRTAPSATTWLASDLRRQLALALALQLFAAIVLGGSFVATRELSNDRIELFRIFRDTLHALNVYGEFPWWNPSVQAGFPFYYLDLLYWPGREPLFSLIAGVVWLLGRAGVTTPSYYLLYVVYIAFLVPVLLSLSILALARQIIRHPLAIAFVIVVSAFSPGVVFSMSDMGIELTAYGFLFAAALLRFLRRPGRASFLLMCVPAVAMTFGSGFLQLFWVAFFVPVFALAACAGARGLSQPAARALRAVPMSWWTAAAIAIVIGEVPILLAYRYGSDVLAIKNGERYESGVLAIEGGDRSYYAYEQLRPGNPLEALALSTPAVGFNWTDSDASAMFQARPLSKTSGYVSYGYLGMLTLSLACLGLACGRPWWSLRLFACITAGVTVMLLSGYSPIFSLVLGSPSPLRAIDHFSDSAFRIGLFALFVLAAGLGVETVLRGCSFRRWVLAALFACNALASVAWLVSLQGRAAADNYAFGAALVFMLLFGVGLVRFAAADTRSRMRNAFVVLLALTALETSTFAFAHRRLSLEGASMVVSEPDSSIVGTDPALDGTDTPFVYLQGVDMTARATGDEAQRLTLSAAATGEPLVGHAVTVVRRTYNTLFVHVNAVEPARLGWQDAFSPWWRAWVNGIEVAVERTPQGMKAVRVPTGQSDVVFRFFPGFLRLSIIGSYLTLLAAAALAVREHLRVRSV